MKYRSEIDGLRAVAVVPVILFHAGFSLFGGGYVGVDIFFVISGYLITSILLTDLEQDRFSILKFYERRARRILPALFFVMACCVPFAWAWMHPSQLEDFGAAVLAVLFFVSNILFWQSTDYFAPDVEENPLLHTWSLAVEEQFYILFPIVLFLLWRLGRRAILPLFILTFLLSLGLAEWTVRRAPGAAFYLIPTRAWELLAGSICAWMLHNKVPRENDVLAGAGLLAIVVSIVVYDDQTPFPSFYALAPVIGTALIIYFAGPGTYVARLLSMRGFVWIGLISYSAYLWHQPLFAFARVRSIEHPSGVMMLLLSGVTLGLAWISWRYVERPFRAGPHTITKTQGQVFWVSGATATVFAAFGLLVVLGQGLPNRTAPSGTSFADLDIAQRIAPNRGIGPTCDGGFESAQACRSGGDPEILLWGDSFAMHLGGALRASPTQTGIMQLTIPACMPVDGVSLVNAKYTANWAAECIAFNDRVLRLIETTPSLTHVVMSSPMGMLTSVIVDRDGRVVPGLPSDTTRQAMERTATMIREAGAVPVFVTPPPRTGQNLSSCPIKALIFGSTDSRDCGFMVDQMSERSGDIRAFLSRLQEGPQIMALDDLMCPDGLCLTFVDDTVMYRDSGHLSQEGSEYLGEQFDLLARIQAVGDAP